ncbi:MAG: EAL domain-containing protein [Pyrinomonadaceae bacterium]|nr:EAL domain-containing protein [Pyrinomonadaceae bacterium]
MLAASGICFGYRVTVRVPKLGSTIAASDIVVFTSLGFYEGEVTAILVSVISAFAARHPIKLYRTFGFDIAGAVIAVLAASLAMNSTGSASGLQALNSAEEISETVVGLTAAAFVYFAVNSLVAVVRDTTITDISLTDAFNNSRSRFLLSSVVGTAGAGLLLGSARLVGLGSVLVVLPGIFCMFVIYRMYLANLELTKSQVEKAEDFAELLRMQSAALSESESRFRSAFTHAPIGIAIVSPMGSWLKVNNALSGILGYSELEFLITDYQSMLHPDDLGPALIQVHQLMAGKATNCQFERRFLDRRGNTVWALCSLSKASGPSAADSNLIFQLQDITARKLAEDKLLREAMHDSLTGLPNRANFMNRLSQALDCSKAYPEYNLSIMFIDLDRFKNVNDSLGHAFGDQLLVEIAQRLCACVRPADMVARLGGDEFVVLVPGKHSKNEVDLIAERIQSRFTAPFELNGHEIYSSASIGILHATENHNSAEEMMRDADTAMYKAKRSGRARHEVFDEKMHLEAIETLRLESDLRRAIQKREFEVFYQPIYSLATDRPEGVEALARWKHPELGYVSPAKFIPLAEEIGLIDELGDLVLATACDQMGSILCDPIFGSRVRLSVNLSSRQFAREGLLDRVRTILTEANFPPSMLKIEITESVFFAYQERAIEMLHELRTLGIDIDIDDFGTGYSNLSYLVRLPISTLKIDRSFVSPINAHGANTEIVKMILAMAKNLGLRVVAEGVETAAQLDSLRKLGCEGAQGFKLARPMSFAEARAFFSSGEDMRIPEEFNDVKQLTTLQ